MPGMLPRQLEPEPAADGAAGSAVVADVGADVVAGHSVNSYPSLPEAHRSIPIHSSASWFRKRFAFAGPGFLIAVGYMDPGNWATDLAAGSKYNYTLLSVIMLSNFMAILLQALAIKLGVVSGRDLAQACRDHFSRRVSFALWIFAEIAIAACDLAEVI